MAKPVKEFSFHLQGPSRHVKLTHVAKPLKRRFHIVGRSQPKRAIAIAPQEKKSRLTSTIVHSG